eukprot:scaffold87143_cov17-Prasinocladus_malaysianus.AAC.1
MFKWKRNDQWHILHRHIIAKREGTERASSLGLMTPGGSDPDALFHNMDIHTAIRQIIHPSIYLI